MYMYIGHQKLHCYVKVQFLMPSKCQTKHSLGFKLGDFTNYPKAYMHEEISLPATSELFWWALFRRMQLCNGSVSAGV